MTGAAPHPTLQEVGVHVGDWCVRLHLPQFLILILEIRMQIRACGYDCFGGDPAAVWHDGMPPFAVILEIKRAKWETRSARSQRRH